MFIKFYLFLWFIQCSQNVCSAIAMLLYYINPILIQNVRYHSYGIVLCNIVYIGVMLIPSTILSIVII